MIWDEDYIRAESPGDEQTAVETAFLIEALELTRQDRVLDIACGAGRHAKPLAEFGAKVVGVDASYPLIRAATTINAHENVAYLQADMRALPFHNSFDVAICLFASFGLCDDDGNRETLRSIARALMTNGVALIETWNPFIAAELDGRANWWRVGDRIHLARAEYDPVEGVTRDHREIIDQRDGDVTSWTRVTRFYTAPELTAMARSVGLTPLRWFGDFDGSDYEIESPRLIVAVEKTDEKCDA
ncbi:MAG: class I SAM-dependent methyltransferase [Candidatus Poribacteria bacterium]|nr:class I SAM-dependent methyltransferase [Candidatus Poribacteria bacterium]